MCQIAFEMPNEVLFHIHMNAKEVNDFAKRVVAMELFKSQNVSVGYCAQIAGLSEEAFIQYLGRNKVSVFHFDDEDEFEEELQIAKNHS